jgi:hypothetical protein
MSLNDDEEFLKAQAEVERLVKEFGPSTDGPDYFPIGFPRWKRKTFQGSVPSARSSHTTTTTNQGTCFLLFGGAEENDLAPSTFLVDGTTFETVELSSVETPVLRAGHTAIEIFNHVYVFGGWDGQNYSDAGFMLNIETERMYSEDNKSRAVPNARRDQTLTRIGRKAFLFGGWDAEVTFKT